MRTFAGDEQGYLGTNAGDIALHSDQNFSIDVEDNEDGKYSQYSPNRDKWRRYRGK